MQSLINSNRININSINNIQHSINIRSKDANIQHAMLCLTLRILIPVSSYCHLMNCFLLILFPVAGTTMMYLQNTIIMNYT